MARHYATRDFFRQMPNPLLARYFHARGVLGEAHGRLEMSGHPGSRRPRESGSHPDDPARHCARGHRRGFNTLRALAQNRGETGSLETAPSATPSRWCSHSGIAPGLTAVFSLYVGPDLSRPDGHGRGDRPPGAPRRGARVRRAKLSNGPVPPDIAAPRASRTSAGSAVAAAPSPGELLSISCSKAAHRAGRAGASRQRRGKRAQPVVSRCTITVARFPPRFGRRKRRPQAAPASSSSISTPAPLNRQK